MSYGGQCHVLRHEIPGSVADLSSYYIPPKPDLI